ncbi:hypothetical protein HYV44_01010 [Candidatus Microgenomates bacterium]|nr:hypothetical protein [Candidatus Microgenomates bacterium]
MFRRLYFVEEGNGNRCLAEGCKRRIMWVSAKTHIVDGGIISVISTARFACTNHFLALLDLREDELDVSTSAPSGAST